MHLVWELPLALVIPVIAGLMFFESGFTVGLVMPGASAVVVLGAMTGQSGCWPFVAAAVGVGVASAFGAQLSYRRLRRRTAPTRGAWSSGISVFVNHHVGGLRTVSPRLAAADGTSAVVFSVASTAAALVWATILVSVGRYAVRVPVLGLYGPWLMSAGAVAVIAVQVWRVLKSRPEVLRRARLRFRVIVRRPPAVLLYGRSTANYLWRNRSVLI